MYDQHLPLDSKPMHPYTKTSATVGICKCKKRKLEEQTSERFRIEFQQITYHIVNSCSCLDETSVVVVVLELVSHTLFFLPPPPRKKNQTKQTNKKHQNQTVELYPSIYADIHRSDKHGCTKSLVSVCEPYRGWLCCASPRRRSNWEIIRLNTK